MKLNRVLSFLLLFPIMATAWAANDYTQYVNPWIGTGGHGHVFLGANVPWGYVQLGPTENTRGWDWCSGYHISDSVLIGFGHQHLSGTGIGDLGDFAFLPVARSGQRDIIFSHGAETVTPGYYAISLHDPNVFVELTATKRCGFHRYTYAPTTPICRLAIDLKQGIGWDSMTKAGLEQVDATTLKGYRMSKGWAVDQRDYFYVRFSKPVTMTALDSARWEFTFSNGNEPLLVKVGLSAVSEDNARLNLEKEIPGWDFNGCVAQARQQWNDELSKIQIETPDANARTIFYTAMYHTMTAPSVFNDVNGDYRGADGKIHKGDFQNYTTFSLWDTYRSAHPLMTLIHPDMLSDIGETLINICRQQGKLPVWHLMGCETDCTQSIKHIAKFISGIWQIHPFCEGNTRTTAVFMIKYLQTFGFNVSNQVFADNSWYFRNALVRANYNDLQNDIHATTEFLERFIENLLTGTDHELKNRYMHIEYTESAQSAKSDVSKCQNCTLEELALLREIAKNPTVTQKELALAMGVSERTIKRRTVELQEKDFLRRKNGKRNGRWEVLVEI